MDFISWSVFGILFALAETATGTLYLLAIGLAFIYPAIADFAGVSANMQIAALASGIIVHSLIVMSLRKRKSSAPSPEKISNVGQRVEVIEWIDECSARVMFQDKEWQADKVAAEMPDADHGIIVSEQYGRLIISTKQPPAAN